MGDGPLSDPLAEQYERWPYPSPLRCLDHPILEEARIPRRRYWPRGGPDHPRVLVAGCGTREAALVAYYNPEARVTGIDVSETSLRHERRLKADYGLTNLELHRLSLERASHLGAVYDLVHCHGVLHHLESPLEGLKALRGVLDVGGS
ncbi:MAG: class I SAM-dependent methyltransferase, partial [Candidatus Eisenbacteria bacterium]|nr:class I SAM-dependent methyltransferase [Candidatus Eisenbacteria bacterium]